MRELNDDYMAERAEWVFYPRAREPKDQTYWWLLSGLIFGLMAAVIEFFWGRA
jgi:hypothetical protein